MGDALTIVVVHFSRQQSQSLLNVGQISASRQARISFSMKMRRAPSSDVSARSPRLGKRGTFRAGPRAEC